LPLRPVWPDRAAGIRSPKTTTGGPPMIRLPLSRLACAASMLALAACGGEAAKTVTWEVTEFIGPSPFHGLQGLAVEGDGTLLAGSVVGQAIYAVNPATGDVTERMGPPNGMADDIAFGPNGEMAWTGYLTGK